MSVWWAVPSARPGGGSLEEWRAAGYKTALFRDRGAPDAPADLVLTGEYPGYGDACNRLIRAILKYDSEARWVITGGDDTSPDPTHSPESIAAECEAHFGGTFGVAQPTGDRYAMGSIDRIAGSPWLGRAFCQRALNGKGPYDPRFTHMFADEYILGVAEALGVYWRRPDLIHFHQHFMRDSDAIDSNAVVRPIPPHLVKANSPAHWDEAKRLFLQQKADGFREALVLAPATGA
jgi:hypothetical protein